jgi:hypothetical protein
MKKASFILAIVALVLASLACKTIMGGSSSDNGGAGSPTSSPTDTSGGNTTAGSSDYPMPDDASNVINIAGVTNFQTKLSLDDAMNFYRDQLGKDGYTERTDLTVTASGTFSMVFDGDPSGKVLTVQGVDLGDGTTNIAISLQDL